jgi:hypothetical protein
MESLYREVGISSQAHHKNKVMAEKRLSYNEEFVLQVKQAQTAHPRMGSRLLYRLHGVKGTGINRFGQLIRREGLGIKRKRNYRKTADGYNLKAGLSIC